MARMRSTQPAGARRTIRWSMQPAPEAVELDAAADSTEAKDRWWRESSFDLRRGLDVFEKETIPGELLDEFPDPKP